MSRTAIDRAHRFCARFGLDAPICEAPMAGSSGIARAAAVAAAGGMAGYGAYPSEPDAIRSWVDAFRAHAGDAALQVNLWVPGPPPRRDPAAEAAMRAFVARWVEAPLDPAPPQPPPRPLPDMAAQAGALIRARPRVASSTMGLFSPDLVRRLREAGIAWFATVTTLAEAIAAERAGADALIAQGSEAGGHRGTFDPRADPSAGVGLMALLPQLADRVSVPIVAAGGIADARGIAAALTLGASAVQIGTALLRTPESDTHPAWADALAAATPEGTRVTRVFSGRAGRSLATDLVGATDMPPPLDFPLQRELMAPARAAPDPRTMQAWAGQAAAMAAATPATPLVRGWWRDAQALLPR